MDLEDSLPKGRLARNTYNLEAYHLPLDSGGIERTSMPNVMLGKALKETKRLKSCRIASGRKQNRGWICDIHTPYFPSFGLQILIRCVQRIYSA